MFTLKKYSAIASAVALLTGYQSTIAQTDSETADGKLEEIVVTAQRRAQNLQEVPIAISALSETMIERADIHDLTDIATRVPGLTLSPFSPGQNIVSLRGAASNDDGAGTDNSVAMFVDDVYLGRVSNINPEIFDLERVEVLRGPQGTLYGKNTIGGAINVISLKPNHDQLEAKVTAKVGSYNRTDLSAYVTGPLSDSLAGKVVMTMRQRDGWVDNKLLNTELKDDDAQGFRAQLSYQGEGFRALFSADFNKLDVEDMARVPYYNNRSRVYTLGTHSGTSATTPSITVYEPNPWRDTTYRQTFADGSSRVVSYISLCPNQSPDCSANRVDGYAKREASGISAKLSFDVAGGELISITAFRESEADWNMDSSGAPNLALIDDIFDTTEQFSQELRFVSTIGDNINYVAGFWYLTEETDRTECFDLTLDSDCTPYADLPLGTELNTITAVGNTTTPTDWYRQINETTSFALFGQVDWQLSERISLSLGARYSSDEKDIDNRAIGVPVGPGGAFVIINSTFAKTQSESWSKFTPKIAVNYQLNEDLNLYASFTQGFKSGGFPAAPQSEEFTAPLDEETADNLEFGFKGDFADSLRLNAAVFFTEYEGLQIQTFGPSGLADVTFGTFQTFNAGDAEIFGVELEAVWAAAENLQISGFLAFQDSEFGKTNIIGTPFFNQEGQDLLRTPELKYNLNFDYALPLGGGSMLDFSLSYRYTDEQRGTLPFYATQDEFSLVDVRVGWTAASDTWEVAFWGKNIADEEYIAHVYTVGGGVVGVYGEPAMFGLTGTWRK